MARMPVVPEGYLNGDSSGLEHDADARVQRDVAGLDLTGLSSTPNLGSDSDSGSGLKNPIGPVQGYPEDGRHAWRAANDDAIVAAVNKY